MLDQRSSAQICANLRLKEGLGFPILAFLAISAILAISQAHFWPQAEFAKSAPWAARSRPSGPQ
jgi:hypothetical protein